MRAQGTVPLPQGPLGGPCRRGPQEKADTGARAEPAAPLNRPVPLRAPAGREGRRPRRPQEYRAQGTVPLPQGPMGGTASSRSARKGRHRGPRRTCSATQPASTLASSGRPGGTASPPPARISGAGDCAPPTGSHGRDRVLAVRKERQTPGPVPNPQRAQSASALASSDRPGWTASPPSARISGAEDCAPPGGRSPAQFF
jgi:hypothetical protein